MKVYLSMSSKDLAKARGIMDAIRGMGHEIVLDWTASFDELVPKSSWPSLAELDVDKVAEADVMVLWGEPTSGCFVELGAAIASRKPVVWVTSYDSWEHRHFFLHYDGAWALIDTTGGLCETNVDVLAGIKEALAFTSVCVKSGGQK